MDGIEFSEKQRDKLAELVLSRYDDARAARNGVFYLGATVEDWLVEAYDRYMGRHGNSRFNLTRIKTGALHAKVKDMVINAVDAPFVISPTAEPTLSKQQREAVRLALEDALGAKLIDAGIVIVDEQGNTWPNFDAVLQADGARLVPSVRDWLKEQAVVMKTTTQIEAKKIADKAAKHATRLMQDQLLEGGWRDSYLDCLFDVFLYGTGVMRCELREVQALKWNGDKLKAATDKRVIWRHVPIAHCYPSSDSEHAQEGTYFIERGAMRKQDLFAAVQIDWIDADKVAQAYEAAVDNFHWLDDSDPENRTRWDDDAQIDVLIHEGTARGDVLLDWLDDEHSDIDEDEFYDIEAWVLAGVTIGMRVLAHPNGMRSYFSANFQRAGRNFWGIGSGMTLAAAEDRLNGYLADLHDNLELAVAPPIFYNIQCFESPEDVTLAKRARIPFAPKVPGDDTNPPFYQPQFDSKSGELVNLFNWAYRLADDESGIPGLLSGNSDLMGGESTFRGMKMLAASANTLIKSAFLNIDQTLIQPAMAFLWRKNMLESKDESIKADVEIVARGASGLMQQEIANAERMDVLPVLMELIAAAGLDEQSKQKIMTYLMRQTMQQGGLPVDELVDDPQVAAETGAIVQSLQPATPMPTIGNDQNIGGLNVS